MKALWVLAVGTVGLSLALSGVAYSEQAKGKSKDAQATQGQASHDPATPSEKDKHLGPQQDVQSSPGFEGANKDMSRGKTSGGQLSEKISPESQEQMQGSGTRREGNDPVEQQSHGPASGKSSGVGGGQ